MAGETVTEYAAEAMSSRRWQEAALVGVRPLIPGVHEVILNVPSWPGHIAGQHVDVRTFRAGTWSRARSFSIANAPAAGPERATRIRLAVQAVADGDQSYPFTDPVEDYTVQVDGPRGKRMTWRPEEAGHHPLLLIGGGTGIVPLMAIAEAWVTAEASSELKVLYSVRSMESQLFAVELARLSEHPRAEVATIVTRAGPRPLRSRRDSGRLSALDLELFGWSPGVEPECYVCGPVPFVESVTRMLVQTKHSAARIRTEWLVPMEDSS
ncbi:MAG: oxidoreductase [Lacisediminihabitans sp.]